MLTLISSRYRRRQIAAGPMESVAEHHTTQDPWLWLTTLYACSAYGLAWCFIPPGLFPTPRDEHVDR